MKLLETGPSPRGWSRLQSILECPQKYAYRYEFGEQGYKNCRIYTESAALIKGTLMHLILAHYYSHQKAKQEGTTCDLAAPHIAVELSAIQHGPNWEQHIETVQDCFDEYLSHWRDDSFKVVAVEQLAYVKIQGHLLTGRFDLVVEDSEGSIWIIDHKTTSRLSSSQRKYYGVSGQLIGYQYIGREIFGDKFAGLLLNQIQHKPPRKFARVPLPPAPNLMQRFPQIVVDAEERIAHLQATRPDKTNWPMVANELGCFSRYGACKFLDTCRWGAGHEPDNN